MMLNECVSDVLGAYDVSWPSGSGSHILMIGTSPLLRPVTVFVGFSSLFSSAPRPSPEITNRVTALEVVPIDWDGMRERTSF